MGVRGRSARVAKPAEMDWETSKENFQPLKQGRHPTKLLEPAAKAPVKVEECAEQERRKYWKELEEYAGSDPLEVWLRFIKWTQDTFKSGGHKAELLPLLERCTRELQGNDRYKKDIRYLRVWIQYADLLPEPRDIFTFLKEHDIGQEFAMYYIAYAAFSELRGNFTRAESIYQQGLERMAHPIERLRTKHEEFKHRMERRALRKAQEGNAGLPEDADLAPARAALGTLRSTKHRAPRPRQAPGGAGGVARPKRKGIFGPGSEPSKQSGGLEIFVDDEFQSGGRQPSQGGLPSSAAAGPSGPMWAQLGTFEQTRKENVQQAGAWAGQKLKQKKALVVPAAEALEVLEDEDLAAQPGASARAGAAPQGTLRQRLDAGDIQEHLREDPLRLHKDVEAAGASSGSQVGAQAEAPHAQPAPKRKREETFAWDSAALTADTDELSFEELRGQQWLARQPQPDQAAQGSPGGMSADMELSSPEPPSKDEQMPEAQQLASQASDSLRAVQSSLTAAAERGDQVRLGRSTSLSGSPETDKAAEPVQAATPTSRSAMVDQITSVSQALGNLGSMRGSESMQSHMPATGADVTMATQAAFSELNGMFTSSPLEAGQRLSQLPGGAAVDMQAQQAAASAADVTMVTRNTFDSVNSMFQGALPQNSAWPQQAPGAAQSRARMSLAGPRTARLFAGEPAAHAQRAALGPEPTVTISTQAAFSTLNDMFRSDLPHEGSRSRRGRLAMQPHEAMQKRPDSAEGFPVYEDTQLLAPAPVLEHAPSDQQDGSQAMHMYEDTQFLGGAVPSPQPAAPQMQLYEDTQFMQENSAAMPARHADPQLMQARSSGLHGIGDTRLGHIDGHAAAAPSPGFQLYEDTQFISAPTAAAGGAARMQQRLLPTASFPLINGMGTPGIAGGHEGHTAFLAENVRPPTPAVPAGDTFDSPTRNKENEGCSPMPSSSQRRLSDPMVEQGVLQDIPPARAADLGISIADTGYERDDKDENAMPALDRLRLEGSNVQDDFEVFSNVTARQLFHTNGGI